MKKKNNLGIFFICNTIWSMSFDWWWEWIKKSNPFRQGVTCSHSFWHSSNAGKAQEALLHCLDEVISLSSCLTLFLLADFINPFSTEWNFWTGLGCFCSFLIRFIVKGFDILSDLTNQTDCMLTWVCIIILVYWGILAGHRPWWWREKASEDACTLGSWTERVWCLQGRLVPGNSRAPDNRRCCLD